MDLSLLITIGFIFLVTLIGAYLRSTTKDRCLRSFNGFHVTLERTDDRLVWGVLHLEPTGLELCYQDGVQDDRHIESSYVLYASEYGDIQALYRYADALSDAGRKKRARDIAKSFHPGPLRRLRRAGRNFLITATDSLNEVLGVILGRVSKTGGRYLADGGSDALKNLVGGKVLGQVGGVYDPLLERHIGHRVVIEILEGNEVHEHVGIFKEYSPDFLEILDVQYPERVTVPLSASGGMRSDRWSAAIFGDILRITNSDERPILIRSLQGPDKETLVNAVVDSGEHIELHLNGGDVAEMRLNIQIARELDLIAPRTRCVVRHRAENFRADNDNALLDLVFDVGKILNGEGPARTAGEQEIRLREELQRNPKDALAAANLGAVLVSKNSLVEAERWLRQALVMEYSLPDSGRRVRMALREVERRRLEAGNHLFGAGTPATPEPAGSETSRS